MSPDEWHSVADYEQTITDLEKTLVEMEERIYGLEDHLVERHACSHPSFMGMRARTKISPGDSE